MQVLCLFGWFRYGSVIKRKPKLMGLRFAVPQDLGEVYGSQVEALKGVYTQRAQYPLIKEYSLNHIIRPLIV